MTAFFPSSSPTVPTRQFLFTQPSSPAYQSRIDDDSFLSSDLDVSFASVSVNSEPNSPTHSALMPPPTTNMFSNCFGSPSAMDISPAPPAAPSFVPSHPQRSTRRSRDGIISRSRSNTIGPIRTSHSKQASLEERIFGKELSNAAPTPSISKALKSTSPTLSTLFEPSPPTTTKPLSGRQRVGLPSAWVQQPGSVLSTRTTKRSGIIYGSATKTVDSPIAFAVPAPVRSDAMDLDSPRSNTLQLPEENFITSSPAAPVPAASNDFGSLFFETSSPAITSSKQKKRRSPEIDQEEIHKVHASQGKSTLAPSSPKPLARKQPLSSSPADSPSANRGAAVRTFDRFATTGGQGSLFNLSKPGAGKRPALLRPGINPLINPAGGSKMSGPKSAHPGLYGPSGKRMPTSLGAAAGPRRAFSAIASASVLQLGGGSANNAIHFDQTDDDTDLDDDDDILGGIDGSSPGVLALQARNGARAVSFMNNVKSGLAGKSMMAKLTECLGAPGGGEDMSVHTSFPEHHGSEAHGKVLPCHGIKEDGLMRINPDTMVSLLRGEFDDRLDTFHVVDCRFDYEYDGGHIEGAINLNTNDAVEKFFFESVTPPQPSSSGTQTQAAKTVIVFHCEFSAKRAPTFAKFLRCQDRKMNQEVYPNIHYPEVYILEGGYSGFYRAYPEECGGYVEMDDPKHVRARCEDLNNFRRWERTRSYTYGEQNVLMAAASGSSGPPAPSSRHVSTGSVPTIGSNVTAAASVALSRRTGASTRMELTVLEEDVTDTSFTSQGDSPCPRVVKKAGAAKKFGAAVAAHVSSASASSGLPTRRVGRLPMLERAATFSSAMMRC